MSPEVSVPLTYNGRNCGSCDNLNTARYFLMKLNKWTDGKVEIMHTLSFCSFLMKLATWIDSRVEIMHILLLCLPNIKFGCYGNLKLPLVYNGKMRILQ